MKKTLGRLLCLVLSFSLISTFVSCQDDDFQSDKTQSDSALTSSEIATFSPSDLDDMEEYLNEQGITLAADSSSSETKSIFFNDLFVKAIKVSCKSPNPNNDGTYVDMSGVLLVPKKTLLSDLKSYRIMVATPPTYTSNADAPSNLFKRVSLMSKDNSLNMFYFFTLQAKSGYAVLIPDYLGYGDSYKQCIHPYMTRKPMVNSVIDLIKAAQSTLSANGYRYKKELVITGYSQGGFVAASLARELETKYTNSFPVNLLVTGGTPCNLKQIVDIVRSSKTLVQSYFIPLAIWGFQQSSYPQINVNTIMKEPYASRLSQAFDGTQNNDAVQKWFDTNVQNVYTEQFIKYLDTDPSMAYMNDILEENSLKPWANKCKFIMTHGISDISVYYQNAKDFADQQNAFGGKVTFISTLGNHVAGIAPYYLRASSYFCQYK